MPEFTGHRDLRAYLRMFWRWKLLVLAILIAAPAVAYLSERNKPHIYQSSVLVSVPQTTVSSGASAFSTDNISTIAALVNTTPVANIAGNLLNPKQPGSAIVGDVSASPNTITGLLTITATTTNPVTAADIANAFAKALGVDQHDAVISATKSEISADRAEERGLAHDTAEYQTLQEAIQTAQAQLKAQSDGATVLEAATPNYTAVGPHKRRTVELGFVVGLLIAFALVVLLEGADRRMHSPDDLESLTDLPLLAAIASSAFSGQLETTPVDEEAFQTLRTSLTYFTVDQPLNSILITSPGEKEGKSTTASRLALAAAHAGLDVILVDADLRRGGTSDKFGLANQPGLGTVLAERRPVHTALVDRQLRESGTGRLRILAAGPPPPNPAALVSSEAMRGLLTSLEADSDLLIIDSPAALAVSDAVPLMRFVSGVVMVARMNQSTRETVHRLQKIIESAHGRILGVVATGVVAGPGYEKYSQAYYTPAGEKPRRGRKRTKKRDRDSSSGVRLTQAIPPDRSQSPDQPGNTPAAEQA